MIQKLVVLLLLGTSITATDYPCWRGADGSGMQNSGLQLVTGVDPLKPKWVSTDPIPPAGWDITSVTYSGGLNNPVVADGLVYLTYYEMSGDVVDADLEDMMANDKRQNRAFPTKEQFRRRWLIGADDVVHAFDADTGRTAWRQVFKDTAMNYNHRGPGLKCGPHMTPCIADGKLYVSGALGKLACLDGKTGTVLWEHPVPEKYRAIRDEALEKKQVTGPRILLNMHLHVIDGTLVVPDGALVGYEAQTGKRKWSIDGGDLGLLPGIGPVRWIHGTKTYLLIGTSCVDPSNGKLLWRAPGTVDSYSSATVGEDMLVVSNGKDDGNGYTAFRMTPTGAELAWKSDLPNETNCKGTNPVISDGHLFAHIRRTNTGNRGNGRGGPHFLVAFDLKTGKETSRVDFEVPFNPVWDSLVGGDGLVFKCPVRVPRSLKVFDIRDPAKISCIGSIDRDEKYGWCSTGAFLEGRLYFRRWNHLVCYDFRK